MNGNQITKATMYQQVKLCFQKHYDVFKTIAPLKVEMDSFYAENEKIEPLLIQQQQNNGNVTQTKEQLKKIAIDCVITLAKKARPWAKKTANNALMAQWNIVESDFKVDQLVIAALMDAVVKSIGDNKANLVLYNINDADIDAATVAVTGFKNVIGTPQQQRDVAQINNAKIPVIINTIDDILEDTDDLVDANFAKTHADAVDAYLAARIIGSSLGQHTAVIVHVYTDSAHQTPLAGATISIDALKRNDVSDTQGLAEIIKFKAGTYTLKITAQGYADQTIAFTVKNGKRLELDVVMSA